MAAVTAVCFTEAPEEEEPPPCSVTSLSNLRAWTILPMIETEITRITRNENTIPIPSTVRTPLCPNMSNIVIEPPIEYRASFIDGIAENANNSRAALLDPKDIYGKASLYRAQLQADNPPLYNFPLLYYHNFIQQFRLGQESKAGYYDKKREKTGYSFYRSGKS